MRYNVIAANSFPGTNAFLYSLDESETKKIVTAYLAGEIHSYLNGERIELIKPTYFKVFTIENDGQSPEAFKDTMYTMTKEYGNSVEEVVKILKKIGRDVTDSFLMGKGWAEAKTAETPPEFYNIFIRTAKESNYLLALTLDQVNDLINKQNAGASVITFLGRTIDFKDLKRFLVYKITEPSILSYQVQGEISKEIRKHAITFPDGKLSTTVFESIGHEVTHDFNIRQFSVGNTVFYVNPERIVELKEIKSASFDLTSLVKRCEELNLAKQSSSFYSIGMLVRSIIDHVPPIFGKSTFAEVSGGYGTRSFRDSMVHLDKSSRKIADSFLHTPIRVKEVVPNETQIDFSRDMDVLLSEIVRILK